MLDYDLFEVGGCVRDSLLGIRSKDIDFVAVDTTGCKDPHLSFACLEQRLFEEGFEIFLSTPEYFTIRARFPKGHKMERTTADFVLAREEGGYSDGRHPDWVRPGTLLDDLARRDFTVNAIARSVDGEIFDPFGGAHDLERGLLRFVGSPEQRLTEDPLRAFRGFRFQITKGLRLDSAAIHAISNLEHHQFNGVSTERIRDELEKCFKHDTWRTLRDLMDGPEFAVLASVAFDNRRLRLIDVARRNITDALIDHHIPITDELVERLLTVFDGTIAPSQKER